MDIRLPEDTGIEVNKLAGLFRNMNQSYKMFWFKAIVEKVRGGKYRLSYDELVNAMIVDAWYMVLEYHLSLGAGNTKLLEVVTYAGEVSGLKSSEKKEKILEDSSQCGTDSGYIRKSCVESKRNRYGSFCAVVISDPR